MKHVVLEDIQHCTVIDHTIPTDCDICLILGESNIDCTLHCINLCFPNQTSVIQANKERNAHQLYMDCMRKTRSMGLVFKFSRKNSSGPVQFDKHSFEWYKCPGLFPRK